MIVRVNPRVVSLVVASVVLTPVSRVNAQQRSGATVAISSSGRVNGKVS
jgi:hypothetical protein